MERITKLKRKIINKHIKRITTKPIREYEIQKFDLLNTLYFTYY